MGDIVAIDNIPLTGFICRRSTTAPQAKHYRKFKSKCGSKVTLVIGAKGTVLDINFGREYCKDGCQDCQQMAFNAKKLVENA